MRRVLNKGFVDLKGFLDLPNAVFLFSVKCPLYILNQWERSKWGEFQSIYYHTDEYYIPSYFFKETNNSIVKMSETECNDLYTKFENFTKWSCNFYKKLLEQGLTKDQASLALPQNQYVSFQWLINCKELANFLKIKNSLNVSWEVKEYVKIFKDFFTEKGFTFPD